MRPAVTRPTTGSTKEADEAGFSTTFGLLLVVGVGVLRVLLLVDPEKKMRDELCDLCQKRQLLHAHACVTY